jgi:hypothetical protein
MEIFGKPYQPRKVIDERYEIPTYFHEGSLAGKEVRDHPLIIRDGVTYGNVQLSTGLLTIEVSSAELGAVLLSLDMDR